MYWSYRYSWNRIKYRCNRSYWFSWNKWRIYWFSIIYGYRWWICTSKWFIINNTQ